MNLASVPAPTWGSPMRHSFASGTHVVSVDTPGLFHSAPAMRLLLVGVMWVAIGLFVIGGAAIGSLREFELGSLLAFLVGGGVGALMAWLGLTAIRWSAAAAWGVTEITITAHTLRIQRGRWQAEITQADFRSTMVTDQFRVAHELLVMARDHRVIRVLSGRNVPELTWLASLIESQLADGAGTDIV